MAELVVSAIATGKHDHRDIWGFFPRKSFQGSLTSFVGVER